MIEHVSKVRLGWLEDGTSIMEDGLLIKNHSSTAGMAGNDDFLEGPDCVESSC